MNRVLLVGEDTLSCALGERLIATCLPSWQLARPPINTGGVTKLVKALPRYQEQAIHVQPVLCIADTDGHCALELVRTWLPPNSPRRLILRLAVTEAECWLLADRQGFAEFLGVPVAKVPGRPEEETDAKRVVLTLARRSRHRTMRDEIVSPRDRVKPGAGYNLHLASFARGQWSAERAAAASPSLQRAINRVTALGALNV